MKLYKADTAFLANYDFAEIYRTLRKDVETINVPDEHAFIAKERRVPMMSAAYLACLSDGVVSLLRLRNGKMLSMLGVTGDKPWKLVFVSAAEDSLLYPAAEAINDIAIKSGPTEYPMYCLCDCALYNSGTPVLFSGTTEELVEYLGNSSFDAVLVPLPESAIERIRRIFHTDAYVDCEADCTTVTDAEVLDEE